ncbi:uncharacterized protein LOC131951160 [Physella acuta]|uniref:uncharacterized protein LOC131951160 n=1 Tax=Physella acuta TaxID=109671 RepID=UPI0027DBD487|nr:uncharacterized protein LOC131951160 [Physella acuta]XP_059169469.1 uncharacterized protein LOC131951160 [Physella acuta]
MGFLFSKPKPSNPFKGSHECEICPRGEADLARNFIKCGKNPGHRNFIPVDQFTKDYLPERYRNPDMTKLVTSLAATTVLIKVNHTSSARPKSTPQFDDYPAHSGGQGLRLGSGRLCRVSKNTDRHKLCACERCELRPSRVWWKCEVITAAHVVFDASEATATKCVFGYDNKDSCTWCLEGFEIEEVDVDGDWCKLVHATCDQEKVQKLDDLWRNFRFRSVAVHERYKELDDVDKLVVIVSHPHGACKRVSVGQWKVKKVDGVGYTRYAYNTCTCPGSSGATVFRLGYGGLYSHTHSGSSGAQGNFSSRWMV